MDLELKTRQIASSIEKLLHIKCEVSAEKDENPEDPRAYIIRPSKTLSYGAVMGATFLKFGGLSKIDRRQVKHGEHLVFRNILTRLGVKVYCICDRFAFVQEVVVEPASSKDLGDALIRNITSALG